MHIPKCEWKLYCHKMDLKKQLLLCIISRWSQPNPLLAPLTRPCPLFTLHWPRPLLFFTHTRTHTIYVYMNIVWLCVCCLCGAFISSCLHALVPARVWCMWCESSRVRSSRVQYPYLPILVVVVGRLGKNLWFNKF